MAFAEHPHANVARRHLLRAGGGGLLVTAAMTGCDLLGTSPDSAREQHRGGRTGDLEAPKLAQQVRAGKLPPVKDRLPDRPLVVEPVERKGSYGGTWRTFIQDLGGASVYENIGYDGLVRWAPDFSGIIPNVISWDIGGNGREYTFHLRTGMKWSDGEPFGIDDIVFAYEDVLSNKELFPVFPEWLASGGKPAVLEKLDQSTCRFTFAEPYAFFLEWLARPAGNLMAASPKHYLKRFHEKYNPDIDKLVKAEGFAGWTELYFGKGGDGTADITAWQNTELPVLLPWVVTTPLTGTRLVAERNPYYWKTDPDGRQLPYFDRVIIEVVKSPETAVLRTSQGEFSLPSTDVLTPMNKPVLARNRQQGGYHFIDQLTSDINYGVMCLNLTHKDAALRELFRNKDFRIGLSYAINREEMIAAVHQRQGEAYQSAPRPESEFYDERLARQYTAYDLAKANAYLDRAGFTERGEDNLRLRADGKPISFTVELPTGYDPTYPTSAELVQKYWKAVGVDLRVKSEGGSLFWERLFANDHDAVIYSAENGLRDAVLDPGWFFPIGGRCYYARLWADWYGSGGRGGEKPPRAARRQMELYDRINATIDPAERKRLFAQILRISAEEFYVIGTALIAGRYSIVQNDFHNVPDPIPEGSLYPDPAPAGAEQFWSD